VSIKNDGHYFCRAGGNRPDGLNEPVTIGVNLGTAISTGLEKGGSLPQKAGAEAGRDAQKIATDKAGGALKGGLKLK
ncbi:hypothetical protein JNS93_25545, partial [Klebsiella pneumoniae]|nr:hypothetical protein [Klebsiella pneumoniae]